jgi:Rrf2 family iron-sulfur cluster assembly transcriptional regulator
MKISSKAKYAIQAMFQLALHEGGKPQTLGEIAEAQAISSSYLEQLLGQLRNAGLVEGLRGPGGGYRLARPKNRISIAEILLVVDDKACVVEDPAGQDEVIRLWQGLCQQLLDYLGSLTLADFLEEEEVSQQWLASR